MSQVHIRFRGKYSRSAYQTVDKKSPVLVFSFFFDYLWKNCKLQTFQGGSDRERGYYYAPLLL